MSSLLVFDVVKIDDNFPREYLCDVCTNPLTNAKMATPCGHTFCGNCVANFDLNGVKTCQMCREPVLSYCRNLFADQMMANMKGKCDGCSTMIAIELAEDHVRQCTDILEECLCQQKITRKDRLAHMQVCPKEEVTCECGFKTKREEETGHKKNDCRFGQVDCPLMCGAMVTRYLVPSHTLVCTKVVQQCPIDGCGKYLRKEDIGSHCIDEQERHQRLLIRERSRILWGAERSQLQVQPIRSSQKCVFKWNLPPDLQGKVVSPVFEKFERKWRLMYCDGKIELHYQQGLEQIAIVASFIVQTRDDKKELCREVIPWRIILEEGQHTHCDWSPMNTARIPESIIVKMEGTIPLYKYRVA